MTEISSSLFSYLSQRESLYCKFWRWCAFFTSVASQFQVVLLNSDQFLAFRNPHHYHENVRKSLWNPIKLSLVNYFVCAVLTSRNVFNKWGSRDRGCLIGMATSMPIQLFFVVFIFVFLYAIIPLVLSVGFTVAVIIKKRYLITNNLRHLHYNESQTLQLKMISR